MPGVRLPRGAGSVAVAVVVLMGVGCTEPSDGDSGSDTQASERDGADRSPPTEGQEDERGTQPSDAGDGLAEQPPGCEAPALPPPPDEAIVLAKDCIELVLEAGEEQVVDGDAIVRRNGQPPPACAAFGSSFSWQVTDTPPERVRLTAVRQGTSHELAEGTSGDAPGACGTVTVTNPGSDSASLDLRYVLLDCEPTGRAC